MMMQTGNDKLTPTGNDKLILLIRENYKDCKRSNAWLGRKIWEWLRDNDRNAKQLPKKKKCFWEEALNASFDIPLPKTAAQFRISREILPLLYNQLGIIAQG
jgi:hypothetical protein